MLTGSAAVVASPTILHTLLRCCTLINNPPSSSSAPPVHGSDRPIPYRRASILLTNPTRRGLAIVPTLHTKSSIHQLQQVKDVMTSSSLTFSRQLATINDLPPELLLDILDFGATAESSHPNPRHRHRSRLSFLYPATLVSRFWHSQSQILLWKQVWVKNEKVLTSLLKCPKLGSYNTRWMKIEGCWGDETGVLATRAREILERVKGLQELELAPFYENNALGLDSLCLPALESLKHLDLESVHLLTSDPQLLPTASFSLQSLSLSDFYSNAPYRFSFLTRLTSLRHFSLSRSRSSFQPSELEDLQLFLLSVSPFLSSFSLYLNSYSIPSEIVLLLSSFINLRDLFLTCSLEDLFLITTNLPQNLEKLTLEIKVEEWSSEIMVNACMGLSDLKDVAREVKVRLVTKFRRGDVMNLPGGWELVKMMKSKGVELTF